MACCGRKGVETPSGQRSMASRDVKYETVTVDGDTKRFDSVGAARQAAADGAEIVAVKASA